MLVKRAPGIQSFWFAYHNDVPWASWRLCNRFRTKNILILCSIAPLLISVPLKIWRSVRLRFSIRYIPFKAKANLVKNIPLAWNIVLLSLALLTWFSPNIPYVYWTYSNQVRCNFNQFTQGTFFHKMYWKMPSAKRGPFCLRFIAWHHFVKAILLNSCAYSFKFQLDICQKVIQ